MSDLTQDEIYPRTPDLETPWGIEEFLKGEQITRITKPAQFIRLCFKMVEEKQYRTIIYDVDDWPRNPVLVDVFSASAVTSCWRALKRFRTKKNLVKIVRDGGPLHLVETCFKAINAARK